MNALPCLASSLAISCTVSWIASRFSCFASFAASVYQRLLRSLLLLSSAGSSSGAGCYYLAEHLCKFSCMLCLFVSCFFPIQTDLRISLSVSLLLPLPDTFPPLSTLLQSLLSGQPGSPRLRLLQCLLHARMPSSFLSSTFSNLLAGALQIGQILRCSFSFINISTNFAYPFCHNIRLLYLLNSMLVTFDITSQSFLYLRFQIVVISNNYYDYLSTFFTDCQALFFFFSEVPQIP